MAQTNSIMRTVHDLGLATWFGGSLMGAAGVNKAAAEAGSTDESLRFANATWQNWSPVNAAAIGAHVLARRASRSRTAIACDARRVCCRSRSPRPRLQREPLA